MAGDDGGGKDCLQTAEECRREGGREAKVGDGIKERTIRWRGTGNTVRPLWNNNWGSWGLQQQLGVLQQQQKLGVLGIATTTWGFATATKTGGPGDCNNNLGFCNSNKNWGSWGLQQQQKLGVLGIATTTWGFATGTGSSGVCNNNLGFCNRNREFWGLQQQLGVLQQQQKLGVLGIATTTWGLQQQLGVLQQQQKLGVLGIATTTWGFATGTGSSGVCNNNLGFCNNNLGFCNRNREFWGLQQQLGVLQQQQKLGVLGIATTTWGFATGTGSAGVCNNNLGFCNNNLGFCNNNKNWGSWGLQQLGLHQELGVLQVVAAYSHGRGCQKVFVKLTLKFTQHKPAGATRTWEGERGGVRRNKTRRCWKSSTGLAALVERNQGLMFQVR
ncbi:uncharacterized protein [Chiloscyllium punctatum]|uniref:uncharacterized protein n=1 Tax=Chiloscyllium punctatum TaxID=137246 RepID=UPI003B63BACD